MKETLSLGRQRGFRTPSCGPRARHLRTWPSLCDHCLEKTAPFNPWREAKGRGSLQGRRGGQCQVHDNVGKPHALRNLPFLNHGYDHPHPPTPALDPTTA